MACAVSQSFRDRIWRLDLKPFESGVFHLSRTELARFSAFEYVRTFWWFIGVIPLFGVIMMIWTNGLMQIIGMFAFLWPFTIPARAVLTTTKSSRLFTGGCKLFVYEDRLEFIGQSPLKDGKYPRMIIEMFNVRDVVKRGDKFLVRTIKLGMLPISAEALTPEQSEHLLSLGLKSLVVEEPSGAPSRPGEGVGGGKDA